jgi:hypothetical protein
LQVFHRLSLGPKDPYFYLQPIRCLGIYIVYQVTKTHSTVDESQYLGRRRMVRRAAKIHRGIFAQSHHHSVKEASPSWNSADFRRSIMTLDPQPPPPGDHLVPLCEIPVQSSEGGSALPNTTLRQIAIDPNAAVPPTATFVVPNEKVEIPRLRTGIAKSGRRVPRACHSCRQRKMKCTGDTPSCRKCQELGVICEYPAGWKERKTR